MTPKQALRKIEKANECQDILTKIYNDIADHFESIEAYDIGLTYCEGDGFLFLDGRKYSDVYRLTDAEVETLFKLKTCDEVYSFFDDLDKNLRGI